jgi:hypothetical protein
MVCRVGTLGGLGDRMTGEQDDDLANQVQQPRARMVPSVQDMAARAAGMPRGQIVGWESQGDTGKSPSWLVGG